MIHFCAEVIALSETSIFPADFFLFEGFSPQDRQEALRLCHPRQLRFNRGEVLYAPTDYPRALTVILSGECDVRQGNTVLNTLTAGDSFGILTLYSRRETFPTTVIARKQTTVVMISREDIELMSASFPGIAVNIIRFLTGRVEFLEDRTAAFTEPSVEKKLAAALLKAAAPDGAVRINRSRMAQTLGCGRATLYRALDQLEQRQWISREGRTLRLINQQEMERMIQS